MKEKIGKAEDVTGRTGILAGLQGYRLGESTLRPSRETLESVVVPALLKALEETKQRDIVSSCLVALAKIGGGKNPGGIFRKYLTDPDQEIAETALLCFGIAGLESALPDLEEILLDTPKGRRLAGSKSGVNFRKRAFAAYALGLIARSCKVVDPKERVFRTLKKVLDRSGFANRDLPVAAVLAVRLLEPDPGDPLSLVLAVEASRYLLHYAKDRKRPYLARAHALEALARLLGRGGPGAPRPAEGPALTPKAKAALLRLEAVASMKKLLEKHDENPVILQSCVLALGEMGNPEDKELARLLEKTALGKTSRDLQTRFFANIALGYLGGAGSREAVAFLATRLRKRGKKVDKPWVALALGVSQAEVLLHGKPPTGEIGEILLESFLKTRNPSRRGAMAVALGLAQFRDAGAFVQKEMLRSRVSAFKGYCAVSLGLMKYKDAAGNLVVMLEKSFHIPDLLKASAVGLGLMGEKSVVPTLLQALRRGPQNLASLSALSIGLGFAGDRRTVSPLVDMLFNKNLTRTTRAFAAVALGIVGDEDDLPWNSRIAFGLNYRANVETLTGSANGILDLL